MGFLIGMLRMIWVLVVRVVQLCEYSKNYRTLFFKRVNFMSLNCYKQWAPPALCGYPAGATGGHRSPLTSSLARMPIPRSLGAVFGPSLFTCMFEFMEIPFYQFCSQLLLRKFWFCYLSCSVGFYAEMWNRLKHYDVIPCHLSRSL